KTALPCPALPQCQEFSLTLVSTENLKPTSLQNVLGIVGQDTILPCTISSTESLENPQVQWGKITDGHTENIYTYMGQSGGESVQKYRGRTSVPGDGFATGNVSLTLKNVLPADEGIYSCTVISREWSADTATKLKLLCKLHAQPEPCSDPHGAGQGFELSCRSHGWFPEPTVQWVTEYGQGLFADTEIHQDSRKLFSVWSRVTVTGEQGGKVTCEILNPLVQVEKKTTVLLSGECHHLSSLCWRLIVSGGAEGTEGKGSEITACVLCSSWPDLTIAECVTLDADTAHPRLELFVDETGVRDSGVIRCVPNNEKRFDSHLIVLAKQGYTSGKHYWEVDAGKRKSWAVGIALESVTRKGPFTLSPQNGFWVIGLADGGHYWAYTDPRTRLNISGGLNVIGIFLDIPGKQVTFYDVCDGETVYIFSIASCSSQKGKFIPLFSTGPAVQNPDKGFLVIEE
uniref:Uncharacterized protein n=1 Tax=Malurus cyaneus samueli TaxID=2593467 RepID=A0A8C5U5H8_9PASS